MKCAILLIHLIHHSNIWNTVFQRAILRVCKSILLFKNSGFSERNISRKSVFTSHNSFRCLTMAFSIRRGKEWQERELWTQTDHRFEPQVPHVRRCDGKNPTSLWLSIWNGDRNKYICPDPVTGGANKLLSTIVLCSGFVRTLGNRGPSVPVPLGGKFFPGTQC